MICILNETTEILKKSKSAPKLQYDRHQNNPNCKEIYTDSAKSKFNKLNANGNSKGNTLREALTTSSNEFIHRKIKQRKKERMSDEILDMIKRKIMIPNKIVWYKI